MECELCGRCFISTMNFVALIALFVVCMTPFVTKCKFLRHNRHYCFFFFENHIDFSNCCCYWFDNLSVNHILRLTNSQVTISIFKFSRVEKTSGWWSWDFYYHRSLSHDDNSNQGQGRKDLRFQELWFKCLFFFKFIIINYIYFCVSFMIFLIYCVLC